MTDVVLRLWNESRRGEAVLAGLLARVLRESRLEPAARAEVVRRWRDLLRWRRRVDFALAGPAGRLEGGERARVQLLATELLLGRSTLEQARREAPEIDWERVLATDAQRGNESDPILRLGLLHSLPDWFARALLAEHGAQAEAIAASLNDEPPVTVRAERSKGTREELAARLLEEGVHSEPARFAPDGLVLRTPCNVFRLRAFQDGWCELQDEGSQLVALAVAPPPGGTVVDACAGSGGKSLALCSLLLGKGQVLALDVAAHRLEELRARARRAGTSNLRALLCSEEAWPQEALAVARRAERVLVDAPCSGTGAWRRHPEARWTFDKGALPRLRASQERLLRYACAQLRPGARAIYATCSLLGEENEAVVRAVLDQEAGLDLVPLKEVLGSRVAAPIADPGGTFLVTLPGTHGCDGFFAAILRRRRQAAVCGEAGARASGEPAPSSGAAATRA
jgi:16S rRNA (cytosine967-C5)-methyltransferase